jgi:hypothetical protein
MLSRCGLVCTDCPAFIATREDDDDKRAAVARLWSKQFQMDIKPADVTCAGCLADGPHSSYCRVCAIRRCAVDRGLETCARCTEYACETLEKVLVMEPACRQRLDAVKNRT